MDNTFARFNEMFDTEGLAKDVAEVSENSGTVEKKEIPFGEYEVRITKLELTEHKFDDDYKGMPEVAIWFRIINHGELNGQTVFINKRLISLKNPKANGFLINKVNEMVAALEPTVPVVFEDFVQYGELLKTIFEELDGRAEYQLSIFENKGYKDYAIIKRFV